MDDWGLSSAQPAYQSRAARRGRCSATLPYHVATKLALAACFASLAAPVALLHPNGAAGRSSASGASVWGASRLWRLRLRSLGSQQPPCRYRQRLVAEVAQRNIRPAAAFEPAAIEDRASAGFSYYMLHKPPGVVSQRNEPGELLSIYDLFVAHADAGLLGPAPPKRVGAVGRLDRATSGLMILTDDGILNGRLSRAKHCKKRYLVTVKGHVSEGDEALLHLREPYRYQRNATSRGREVWTHPAQVRPYRYWRERVQPGAPEWLGDRTELEVILGDGRHRQIRRLCSRSGLRVHALHRIAVGPLELGSIAEGSMRHVTASEREALYQICGFSCASVAADLKEGTPEKHMRASRITPV